MNPLKRTYEDYLNDMLMAVEKARQFVGEMDLEAFRSDDRTVFAVVRALEVLGEAAKRIPENVRSQYPEIPSREIAGMPDKLSHANFGVDVARVYETARRELPGLCVALRRIRGDLGLREEGEAGERDDAK